MMNYSVFAPAAQRCAAAVSIFLCASTLWAGDGQQPSLREPCEPLAGKLVIVGGGLIPDAVYQRFVELAGGPYARIVVILTASEYAQSTWLESHMMLLFNSLGVLDVQFRTRARGR